jgi:hypothetical protein
VVTTEDVLKLSGKGGAENHIAYVCLYRSKCYQAPALPLATDADTPTGDPTPAASTQ